MNFIVILRANMPSDAKRVFAECLDVRDGALVFYDAVGGNVVHSYAPGVWSGVYPEEVPGDDLSMQDIEDLKQRQSNQGLGPPDLPRAPGPPDGDMPIRRDADWEPPF